jgi:hypothetical protein
MLSKKERAKIEKLRHAAAIASERARAQRRERAIAIADQVLGLVGDNCSPLHLRNVMTMAATADDAEGAAAAVCMFTTRPEFVAEEHGGFTVHPMLELIPMMTGYELVRLTSSIRDHELLLPIELDAGGSILVDGRCRLMACKAAGVEPRFKRLPVGADLDEHVCIANLQRYSRPRSVSYDAVAALAGHLDASDDHWAFAGIPTAVLSAARAVMKERPDSVAEILQGARTLDSVFAESEAARVMVARERHELERLWASAPMIADLVGEGRISLKEALLLEAQRARA